MYESHARDAAATPIGAYRRVIQEYPLLSREQERDLFVRLEAGEESARERLLLSNVRLAIGIARRYAARCHLPLDDLIQEAMFGLLRAIERFDYRTGHRFSTYATMAIQNTVASALDLQLRTIRIPTYMLKARWEVERAAEALMRKLHREPTAQEIADSTGRSESEVARLLALPDEVRSLDGPAVSDSGDSAERTLESDVCAETADPTEAMSVDEEVRGVLKQLTNREQDVLRLHYGLESGTGATLEEISRAMRVTRERVRQIEQGAINKVRRSYGLQPARPRRRAKPRARVLRLPNENWLTLREASDLVGVSKQTVRSWLGKTGLQQRWRRRGSRREPVIEVPVQEVALIGAVLDWVESEGGANDRDRQAARRLWSGFSLSAMNHMAPPVVQQRYRAYVARARRRAGFRLDRAQT